MLEYIKLAVLEILTIGIRKNKSLIFGKEITLPKNVFLLHTNSKYYFLCRVNNSMITIKPNNQTTLERTSLFIHVPQKTRRCDYIFGFQIETETTQLEAISNW